MHNPAGMNWIFPATEERTEWLGFKRHKEHVKMVVTRTKSTAIATACQRNIWFHSRTGNRRAVCNIHRFEKIRCVNTVVSSVASSFVGKKVSSRTEALGAVASSNFWTSRKSHPCWGIVVLRQSHQHNTIKWRCTAGVNVTYFARILCTILMYSSRILGLHQKGSEKVHVRQWYQDQSLSDGLWTRHETLKDARTTDWKSSISFEMEQN